MATGTVVEQLVVELDGRTQKLEAAMKAAEAKLDASAKRMAASTTSAGTAATASGVAVDRMAMRYSRGAQAMAGAAEMAARAGKLTGESAKQMIAQGSMMATMFGPTGAIVGAVGIGTLAIVHMFDRAKDEAKTAREAIQGEFQKLATLESVAAAEREAERLLRGRARLPLTEAGRAAFEQQRTSLRGRAEEFGAEFGIEGLRAEITRLTSLQTALTQAGTGTQEQITDAYLRYGDTLENVTDQLQKFRKEEERLDQLYKEARAQRPRLLGEEAAKASEFKLEDVAETRKRILAAGPELIAKANALLLEAVLDPAVFKPILEGLNQLQLERLANGDIPGAERAANLRSMLQTQKELSEGAEKELAARDRAADAAKAFSAANQEYLDQEERRLEENEQAWQKRLANQQAEQQKREEALLYAQAFAYHVQEAAESALQLFGAFTGFSRESATALRNVIKIATSIEPLTKAFKAGDSMAMLEGAAGIAAAIASVVSVLTAGSVRLRQAIDAFTATMENVNESIDQQNRARQRPDDPRAAAEFDVETQTQAWEKQAFDALKGGAVPRAFQDDFNRLVGGLTGTLADIPIVQALLQRDLPDFFKWYLKRYLETLQNIDASRAASLDDVAAQYGSTPSPTDAPASSTSYTSSGFSGATSTQFDRATDFLRQIAGYTQPITAIEMLLREMLLPAAPMGFDPDMYSVSPAAASAASASNTITFQPGSIQIHVPGSADPQRTGEQIGVALSEEMIRQIDIALAARARRHRQARGDISV
jgi:hypothetical protein